MFIATLSPILLRLMKSKGIYFSRTDSGTINVVWRLTPEVRKQEK